MDRRAMGAIVIVVILVAVLIVGGIVVLAALGVHVLRHILPFHVVHYFRKLF